MSKNQERITGNQGDFFRHLECDPFEQMHNALGEVDLDCKYELRAACAQSLKQARRKGISRDRVVDLMNSLMPDNNPKLTKRKLDGWMAESKEDRDIPAYVLPAFCAATQCDLPLRVLANEIQYDLADKREKIAKELGQAEIQRAGAVRKIKQLKSQIG